MARVGSDFLVASVVRNKRAVFLVAALLAVAFVFSSYVLPALIVLVLGVVASFSTSYKRIIRVPPAVELVTFTTVIVSLKYGPVVGAVYAAVVTLTAEVMTNALDVFIISFIPSRVAVALISGFVFSQFDRNIALAGLACSVFYNLLAQPFYLFMADVEMRVKSVFFVLMNVGSNFVIFAVLGRIAVRLLGIG